MRVRVTLNCPLKPGGVTSLRDFLENNLPNVRGFKGNLNVSVLFSEDNSEMLLDEQWLTRESHLAYLQHIDENGVLNQLAEFLSAPPEIKYFIQADL